MPAALPLPPPPPLTLPLQQSPLYRDALRRIGADAAVMAWAGGDWLVLRREFPVIGRVALVSRPDLAADADPGPLRKDLGADLVIVNAATAANGAAFRRAGFLRLAPPREVAMLSLARQPEDWLARMDGKWRNRLRHAQRQPLTITAGALSPDPNHWIFQAEAAQQRARGYRNLPPTLIAAMGATAGALTLFTAQTAGTTIAAMLFARHASGASYLIGWSDAQGRNLSAHNLILWHAMNNLARQGVTAIDLGQCAGDQADGLARFKRGAGAATMVLGGTWAMAGLLAPLHGLLRGLRSRMPPP